MWTFKLFDYRVPYYARSSKDLDIFLYFYRLEKYLKMVLVPQKPGGKVHCYVLKSLEFYVL